MPLSNVSLCGPNDLRSQGNILLITSRKDAYPPKYLAATLQEVTKKRNKTITENTGNVRFFKIEKHVKH
jgi:hypothetical protein